MKKSVIKNIRKNHLLKTVLVVMSSLFLLWSCTTTDVVDENQKDNTEITEAPKPKDEKKKTEKENEEPANIVFAKKIQAALDKGDVKGAIDLYQNIPAELSSDIDFKLILASLYVSDGQYEKASSVADAVLALDNGNISALEIKTLFLYMDLRILRMNLI